LRAPDLDRREHDATLVVGRDLDADQDWVVRRFGLNGGAAAGSGLRRYGPSMRIVMQ
jgi:hypothetical protein